MQSHRALLALAMLIVAPGTARANLSHVSVSGALLLMLIVVLSAIAPPLLASALAKKGQRLRRYFVALLVWIGVMMVAVQGYSFVPPSVSARWPLAWFAVGSGCLLLAYLCAIVVHHRASARAPKPSDRRA